MHSEGGTDELVDFGELHRTALADRRRFEELVGELCRRRAGAPSALERLISSWTRGTLPPSLRLEDLAARVGEQLVAKFHPREPADDRPGRAIMLAWIKRTTLNELSSAYRRAAVRKEQPGPDGDYGARPVALDAIAGSQIPADDELANRELVHRVQQVLDERFPKGAALWRVLRDEGDLASKELADRLGTSPANVDTIKSRMRTVLSEHLPELGVKRRPKARRDS